MHDLKQQSKLKWWPSPQDYNEAIQNPHVNLADGELKHCKVHTDKLGLPRPMTGAFASVYRMSSGKQDIAFRCFLRNIADQEKRYAMVSDFVQHDDLPYTVSFDFIRQGVKVNGQWFPALKMEYVDGVPLDAYIKQNLKDAVKLSKLADSFVQMCDELRAAGIAHGDLQHGNILVVGDELRLVDYDGMFVPGMEAMQSNEIGHPNYQHPKRDANDFGNYLDNFSAWSIYASLRSLCLDPSLHQKLGVGDDCLLFRRDDYVNPQYSYSFALLEEHTQTEISSLASCVRWNLELPPSAVPPLSKTLPPIGNLPKIQPFRRTQTQTQTATQAQQQPTIFGAALPDWITQGITNAPIRGRQAAAKTQPAQQQAFVPNLPGIPTQLVQPTPRVVRFNDYRGWMNPVLMQWLMLLNPFMWMMIFALCFNIPSDQRLIQYGIDYQASVTDVRHVVTSKSDYYQIGYAYEAGRAAHGGMKTVRPEAQNVMQLKEGDKFQVRALTE